MPSDMHIWTVDATLLGGSPHLQSLVLKRSGIPLSLGELDAAYEHHQIRHTRRLQRCLQIKHPYVACYVLLLFTGLSIAMLWVRQAASRMDVTFEDRAAVWSAFHSALWPPFWRRELDIEDPTVTVVLSRSSEHRLLLSMNIVQTMSTTQVLESVIVAAGLDATGFMVQPNTHCLVCSHWNTCCV